VIVCDGFCSCNVQGAGRAVDETGAVVIGHRGEGLLTSNARRQPSDGPSLNELDKAVIERRLRNHIAQLSAMGYRVTLEPAA
jgi:hypothetical protein